MQAASLDPRIGVLSSGRFYVFALGYDKPETIGTLAEVEAALGLRSEPVAFQGKKKALQSWEVTMRFAFPAWDEIDGIPYTDIAADSKSSAIKVARRLAKSDGHACGGRGRYWFTAMKAQ